MKQKLGYWAFRSMIRVLSLLPFRLIYILSDGLYIFLYHLWGYRYEIVMENLRRSFPEKTTAARRRIARCYYRNLCDITLETLKGFSVSREELQRRYRLSNIELLNTLYEKGDSVIMLGSHVNNWEWGALAIKNQSRHEVIGIYKPLSNPLIDTHLQEQRGRWGLHLRPMQQTMRAVIEFRGRPMMLCLIADQTPSNPRQAYWTEFLHQDTAFLPGPDKTARRSGYPVYYFDTRRIRRGFYEVQFLPLAEHPAELPENGLTERYARLLEAIIRERPDSWLWSHRRWKKKRSVDVS